MAEITKTDTDDLEQFTTRLTETLNGDWEVLSTKEDAVSGLVEVSTGFTPAENGLGDHARVTIRESTNGTYVVTGFVGTLTEDDEFSRERTIAHIEFENVPEKDLRALDAVRDFVQMLAEKVGTGDYFVAK